MYRLALGAGLAFAVTACATRAVRVPGNVRGYEVVVEGRDSLSRALARAFDEAGFRVRTELRGGNRPAAALVYFVFRDRPEHAALVYARLADTRTGRVVAAAEHPLTPPLTAAERAAVLVRLLLASAS